MALGYFYSQVNGINNILYKHSTEHFPPVLKLLTYFFSSPSQPSSFRAVKAFILFYLFIFWLRWVFIAARGLFSSCGERGLLFVAVRGLLTAVVSLAAEHGL